MADKVARRDVAPAPGAPVREARAARPSVERWRRRFRAPRISFPFWARDVPSGRSVTRAVLSGRSWGGYLTLLGLGTQPGRWSLGVAGVPVADYVAAYEDEMEPLKRSDDSLFGGTPEEKPDLYRERSPLTHIDGVRVPVLILAGENDPRCPIRQIDNYLARLRALGKPHEVYRYDAGHSSLVIDETLRQAEASLDFAARHLGTTPPIPGE